MKWMIVDWMSNRCFTNHEFRSYEDGWNFLLSTFSEDKDLEDYFVTKIK
jgi:hypothetical protein